MNATVERRDLLKGLAGLPLATILADPRLARAAAETTRTISITTRGGRTVSGALAMPAKLPAPVMVLVHENRGLNDYIRTMAAELAGQGHVALALDLFGGKTAETADDARALTAALVPAEAADTLSSWIAWAYANKDGTGKVGIVGWCFGGGWALNGSVLAPVDATVVYYGRCDLPAEQLAKLKGPVLGHFGNLDTFINHEMVGKFEAAMKQDGKPYQVFWYDAGHAFANPTGANYHKDDARLAWQRTTEFLAKTLKG